MSREPPPGERLQKLLARSGHGSRRSLERLIEAGRIQLNGAPARLGDRAGNGDKILIDGRPVRLQMPGDGVMVLAWNKPVGMVCSHRDTEGRPGLGRIMARLPQGHRWVAVGRLDIDTSGLLLLTNNGELAHRLMHPSAELDREYSVRVFGVVDDAMLARLRSGVLLDDGRAAFSDIVRNSDHSGAIGEGLNQWFTVCLNSGRRRIVRRLWAAEGLQVSRLRRVRFGPVFLPSSLRRDAWCALPAEAVAQLLAHCNLNHLQPDEPPARRQKTHTRP